MRCLAIKGEDNRRSAVTANDAFAASVMGCRNLAGESLAPYFVCTTQPNVEMVLKSLELSPDRSCQQAQWIRGTFVRRIRIRDLVEGSSRRVFPDLSPNPAMVICDGCYAHTVARCGESLSFCRPIARISCKARFVCVFKGAFRVERAEIEAMKQLAAAWFINSSSTGVATSFGQREFWYAVKEAWKGAWTKQAVEKGFKMQGLVPFNRAHSGRTTRTMNARSRSCHGQGISS